MIGFSGAAPCSSRRRRTIPIKLDDVPKVEIVQVEISNLLFHDVQGAIDADPTS